MKALTVTTGTAFNHFTVLREVEPYVCPSRTARRFECRCKCGTQKIILLNALLQGKTKSCGCKRGEGSRSPAIRRIRSIVKATYNRIYKIKNRHEANLRQRQKQKREWPFQRIRASTFAKVRKLIFPERTRAVNRRHALRQKFKMTPGEFDAMVDQQNGLCAICRETPAEWKGKPKQLCVDHDHSTGKVRGLLCYGCNLAVGFARERTDILKNMIRYLKSFPPSV